MKILNLYAGIGGNRKLWGDEHEIVAVENNFKIARIYHEFFPKDKVIIKEAHQYLLKHFEEFDFIWSSPPCPTHSSFRKHFSVNMGAKPVYPDMELYEEIIFLYGYFKGKFVVENVKGYYEPLISPQEIQRHYFWANFYITPSEFEKDTINLTGGKHEHQQVQVKRLQKRHRFNLDKYQINKRLVLRNCVLPEIGLHIFNCAFGKKQQGELLKNP